MHFEGPGGRSSRALKGGARALDVPPRFVVYALLLLVAALAIARFRFPEFFSDTANYQIRYRMPAGWVELPKKPLSLFRFQNAEREVVIHAFQYQLVAPTLAGDNLDADGLAEYYMDTTRQNQPGWRALRMPDFEGAGVRYAMIRRSKPGKVVITAFATKGNTTFGVSMYGSGENAPHADALLGDFKSLLASVRLVKFDFERRVPIEAAP